MSKQDDPPRSKDGSKILRHVASDAGFTPAAETGWVDAIEAHMTEHVGEGTFVFHELVSDKVHLDVHVIPPGADRAFWTLFTTGMSARPMTLPEGAPGSQYAELSILLPPTWRCDEASKKELEKATEEAKLHRTLGPLTPALIEEHCSMCEDAVPDAPDSRDLWTALYGPAYLLGWTDLVGAERDLLTLPMTVGTKINPAATAVLS